MRAWAGTAASAPGGRGPSRRSSARWGEIIVVSICIYFVYCKENLGSLSLVTLSRTKRQAVGKKTMKKTMKKAAGKKTAGAASGGKRALKGPKGAGLRSGKGIPARKGGKKMGKSTGGKAKGGKGQGPQGQGARGGKQGGRQTAKNPKYNALWCVDLAVQKYLRTCVENILG